MLFDARRLASCPSRSLTGRLNSARKKTSGSCFRYEPSVRSSSVRSVLGSGNYDVLCMRPIRADLAVTEERISALRADLRAEFARVQRKRALHGEIATHHLERDSLAERILKLRGSLRGLSVDDQATISRQRRFTTCCTIETCGSAEYFDLTRSSTNAERSNCGRIYLPDVVVERRGHVDWSFLPLRQHAHG